ncbi:hypothetical protein DL89DRAFT_264484 [Linderina pennispora]|uniref:Uncharacterized protein n=1 Tax=Linderina pennispora TaxID=61395 RepID=A0A1Y1WMY7_9FUNG|nr:uncharacterized protein DL89DRAFT_264484 [Linderina pennispora]ORX74668.1 hypothetical protein DL89DRAFT_264484 [Linderina pennispora]
MLALAALKKAHATAVAARVARQSLGSKAAYQTYTQHSSSLGRTPRGGGKWWTRKTAAARLRMVMPQGPGWAARMMLKSRAGAVRTAGARGYLRAITQSLGQAMRAGPGASGRMAGPGSVGIWTWRTFHSASRTMSSARVVALLQRQTMASVMTQQRKDLSLATPFANETRIRLLSMHDGGDVMQAKPLKAGYRMKARKAEKPAESVHKPAEQADPHPAAAAITEAVPVEHCVLVTVPYTVSAMSQLAAGQQASSADVAQMLADAQKMQQRHTLLLTRLLEKLAATGWNIQYNHISSPSEGVQIALPPSTGIRTAAEMESLLSDWGFDMSLFAAVVKDPAVPQPRTPEAYREEVRDFLTDLDRMPRLSASRKPSAFDGMYKKLQQQRQQPML